MSLSDLLPPYSVTRRLLTMSKTLSEKIRTKSNARRVLISICQTNDIHDKDTRKQIYDLLKKTKDYKNLKKELGEEELTESRIYIAGRMNYLLNEEVGREMGNLPKMKRIAKIVEKIDTITATWRDMR